MRTSIMIAVACGALVATACLGSKPAEAVGAGSYCLEYNEGGTDCSFTTLAQCDETASGIGAECYAVAPQAAIQEPGAYAFHHPNAGLGVEAGGLPEGAVAAAPMRRQHAWRNHRDGHGT
jgi:Protein of unknown function (DUF3551)